MKNNNQYIYLMGGLGNQIFQYLFSQLLRERGYPSFLIIDWYTHPKPTGVTPRSLALHKIYGDRCSFVSLSQLVENRIGFDYINEQDLSPTRIGLIEKTSIHIGYYQNRELLPDLEIIRNSLLLMEHKDRIKQCVIHLRGGDYVSLGLSLDESYYLECVKNIPTDVPLKIASEDHDLALNLMEKLSDSHSAALLIEADEVDVFNQIAKSQYVICADSTFSILSAGISAILGGVCYAPHPLKWRKVISNSTDMGSSVEVRLKLLSYFGINIINRVEA